MKRLILSVLASIGIAAAAGTSPSQMSGELRSMLLNLKPTNIGLTKDNFGH